jgi:uncharacterized protein YndB with AHSA1/START domain
MHFANSVTIRRPASEVFAFLTDPANIPKWNCAIDSAASRVRDAVAANLDKLRNLLESSA